MPSSPGRLTARKHEFNGVTYYFAKSTFGCDPNGHQCYLTDGEATTLARKAHERVDMTQSGTQSFQYLGHEVIVHVANPYWVDFGLFRCLTHEGTFTSSLDHVYCRKIKSGSSTPGSE